MTVGPVPTDKIYIQLSNTFILYMRLKAVFGPCEVSAKYQNTSDHLAWTAENGDPMQEVCISHRIPRAWEQQG